jgi:hypothetical protein
MLNYEGGEDGYVHQFNGNVSRGSTGRRNRTDGKVFTLEDGGEEVQLVFRVGEADFQ